MRTTEPSGGSTLRYCGRDFSPTDIEMIRRITDDPHQPTRAEIARAVCAALRWHKPDGAPKLMSCHVALQRMEAHGVIWLPLPTTAKPTPRRRSFTPAGDPGPPITGTLAELGPLRMVRVTSASDSGFWNELMVRHHYRGTIALPGAQLRHLVFAGDHIVAAFGLGAAAWKIGPRDRFIGWTAAEREAHLPQVVDLHRYLIMPWVHVRDLASHLLGRLARRLPREWAELNAYAPALLETFVEADRFPGTCYAAANWWRVGETQGRGRMDRAHAGGLPRKSIWLYPLDTDFRARLTGGRLGREIVRQPSRRGAARAAGE